MKGQRAKPDFAAKVIIIGDSSVGKTNLLNRFADSTFEHAHRATIGVDLKEKDIMLPDGHLLRLQLWDTAGQERFHHITQSYFKGSAGALLVYSVTCRNSFQNMSKWLNSIVANAPSHVALVLVANKSDLSSRKISEAQGKEFAKKHELPYIETSALTGSNVEQCFELLVNKLQMSPAKEGGKLTEEKAQRNCGC